MLHFKITLSEIFDNENGPPKLSYAL